MKTMIANSYNYMLQGIVAGVYLELLLVVYKHCSICNICKAKQISLNRWSKGWKLIFCLTNFNLRDWDTFLRYPIVSKITLVNKLGAIPVAFSHFEVVEPKFFGHLDPAIERQVVIDAMMFDDLYLPELSCYALETLFNQFFLYWRRNDPMCNCIWKGCQSLDQLNQHVGQDICTHHQRANRKPTRWCWHHALAH